MSEAERQAVEAGSTKIDVAELTGRVELSEADDAINDGAVDKIVRHVWRTGGTVLAVRRQDLPGGGPAAAVLRYPLGS